MSECVVCDELAMNRTEAKRKVYEEVIRAVEGGNEKAKTKLAWFKLSGDGGAEIDKEGAVVLLKERVKDEDFDAMWMLGLCYEYGMGCEQQIREAAKLYKRCRDNWNLEGKCLYDNWSGGRGVMKVPDSLG